MVRSILIAIAALALIPLAAVATWYDLGAIVRAVVIGVEALMAAVVIAAVVKLIVVSTRKGRL